MYERKNKRRLLPPALSTKPSNKEERTIKMVKEASEVHGC